MASKPNPKTCQHRFVEREVLECEHCLRQFTRVYNLNRHKRGNCQENVCQKCNIRFQQQEQLQEHILACIGKQPYQCEFCGKAFMKLSNLTRHRMTHTERCELCSALFYKRIPLLKVAGSEEAAISCPHCDQSFNNQEALDTHVKEHVTGTENPCDMCTLRFANKRQLMRHKQRRHADAVNLAKARKTYECSICKRIFLKKRDLKQHLQAHIDAGLKIHACNLCDKKYRSRKTLRMHMYKHSTDEKKPRCKLCNKVFTHPFSLRYHMRIHNNSKPCVCKICSTGFRQASHLTRHMLTHTLNPLSPRAHKCTQCSKTFAKATDLRKHDQTHTTEKPFRCTYCGKCFLFKRTLTNHINIHTGAKPFKCTFCDKAFAQPGSLHRHKMTHLDIRHAEHQQSTQVQSQPTHPQTSLHQTMPQTSMPHTSMQQTSLHQHDNRMVHNGSLAQLLPQPQNAMTVKSIAASMSQGGGMLATLQSVPQTLVRVCSDDGPPQNMHNNNLHLHQHHHHHQSEQQPTHQQLQLYSTQLQHIQYHSNQLQSPLADNTRLATSQPLPVRTADGFVLQPLQTQQHPRAPLGLQNQATYPARPQAPLQLSADGQLVFQYGNPQGVGKTESGSGTIPGQPIYWRQQPTDVLHYQQAQHPMFLPPTNNQVS